MLYDFQCTQCQHIFEDLVKKDEPNPVCSKCQSPTDKLMSAPQHHQTIKTDMFNHFVDKYPGLGKFKD